jgi:LysR family transcriptional activator of nhaA
MAALNFKHLRYFWAVAKSGSIARASVQLHVTPQSISSQLAELEAALGVTLLRRAGRGLEVTDIGQRVVGYAEEIFGLEDELLAVVREQDRRTALPFRIGIADSVPKSLTYRVVEPALRLDEPVRLICREAHLVSLLADLAVHRLDMVIADRPMPADVKVRAFNHLLGSSDLTIFGAAALLRDLDGEFPTLLDGAPFLMPGEGVAIRPALQQWFESQRLHPRIVGEFDDSALMKSFGQGGAGLFPAPTAIADYVCDQYGVRAVGRIATITEHLYAITTERRMRHPATLAVSRAAASEVFGGRLHDGAGSRGADRPPRPRKVAKAPRQRARAAGQRRAGS